MKKGRNANPMEGNLVPVNKKSILQLCSITYRNVPRRYTTNSTKNIYTQRATTFSIIFRKLFKCPILIGD